jgi:hypothetical protein
MEPTDLTSREDQPVGETQEAISEMAALLIKDIDAREDREDRFSCSPKVAGEILDKGKTHVAELTKPGGPLRSYLDGKHRRITMQSIFDYLRELAKASYPVGGPAAKVRSPMAQFQKRREPTPAELEGLRKGRERMSREAQERRRQREEASAS